MNARPFANSISQASSSVSGHLTDTPEGRLHSLTLRLNSLVESLQHEQFESMALLNRLGALPSCQAENSAQAPTAPLEIGLTGDLRVICEALDSCLVRARNLNSDMRILL